jgi:hypothetical protein
MGRSGQLRFKMKTNAGGDSKEESERTGRPTPVE